MSDDDDDSDDQPSSSRGRQAATWGRGNRNSGSNRGQPCRAWDGGDVDDVIYDRNGVPSVTDDVRKESIFLEKLHHLESSLLKQLPPFSTLSTVKIGDVIIQGVNVSTFCRYCQREYNKYLDEQKTSQKNSDLTHNMAWAFQDTILEPIQSTAKILADEKKEKRKRGQTRDAKP